MKILGLEFSSDLRSVAVGEISTSAARCIGTRAEPGPRGSTGLTLVDRLLRESGIARQEIEVIALGLGPGSHAGIRSAIAVAQGWQLARGSRLLGVGSVEVIAEEARSRGVIGQASIIINAQRSEFYRARCSISESGFSVEPLEIIPAGALAHDRRVIGPAAEGEGRIYPTAAALIRLASARSDSMAGDKLEPIYLRETSFVKAAPARFPAR